MKRFTVILVFVLAGCGGGESSSDKVFNIPYVEGVYQFQTSVYTGECNDGSGGTLPADNLIFNISQINDVITIENWRLTSFSSLLVTSQNDFQGLIKNEQGEFEISKDIWATSQDGSKQYKITIALFGEFIDFGWYGDAAIDFIDEKDNSQSCLLKSTFAGQMR